MTNERNIIFQQNAAYFRFFSYLQKKGLLGRIARMGFIYRGQKSILKEISNPFLVCVKLFTS